MPQSIVLSCPVPHKTDETGREVCLNRSGGGGGGMDGWGVKLFMRCLICVGTLDQLTSYFLFEMIVIHNYYGFNTFSQCQVV